MKQIVIIMLIFAGLWACNMDEVEVYSAQRYLFFADSSMGLDTAAFSFSHYPGDETHDVSFYVSLTGIPATEDLTYEVEVVDSLTTADPVDYEMPENLIFPAGQVVSVMNIRCKNVRPELESQRVYVTFRIKGNENFQPGLEGKQTVRIAFDNIKSKPLWWTGDLEEYVLGAYSDKKFELLVQFTGENDWSDFSLSQARDLTIQFKVYLIEYNVMEEDGVTPMVDGIPCY